MPPSDLDSYGDISQYGDVTVQAGFWDWVGDRLSDIGDIVMAPVNAVGDAVGGFFEAIAKAALQAAVQFSITPIRWWVESGVMVDPEDNPAVFGSIRSDLAPLIGMILLGSILWQAGKMIIQRRREPGINIFMGLLRFLVVTSVYTVVISQILQASNLFAKELFQDAIAKFATADMTVLGTLGVLLLCVFAIVMFLVALVQWVLVFFREAGLVVLVALLPLAASGSIADGTRPWLNRMIPWMLALMLYKPMAAIIYYLGFSLVAESGEAGNGGDGIAFVVIGMVIIICACLALPVMMKFFTFTGIATGGPAAGPATASLLSSAGNMLSGGAKGAGGGGGPVQAADFMNAMGPGTSSSFGGPKPQGSGGGGGGDSTGSGPLSMVGSGGGNGGNGGSGGGRSNGSGGGSDSGSGNGGGSTNGAGGGSGAGGGGGSGGGARGRSGGGSGGSGGGGGGLGGAQPAMAGSGSSGATATGSGSTTAAAGGSTAAAGGATSAATAAGPVGAVIAAAPMIQEKAKQLNPVNQAAGAVSKATGAAANLGGAMTEVVQ